MTSAVFEINFILILIVYCENFILQILYYRYFYLNSFTYSFMVVNYGLVTTELKLQLRNLWLVIIKP